MGGQSFWNGSSVWDFSGVLTQQISHGVGAFGISLHVCSIMVFAHLRSPCMSAALG